nr:NADH dehydrogenase subunit 2 [Pherusa bengalensis]
MLASLPLLFLFSMTLFLGTMLSLSSNNWLMLWFGLELNLMSFLPLLMISPSHQETEGAVKYFLPQAIGSGILLMAGLASYINNLNNTLLIPNLIILALMLKAGMAPMHFWFPVVMASLSWPMCMILSTWQKLAPMLLIFSIIIPAIEPLITLSASLSALIGGLGGLNQTGLRPILAYSSINHMGWMMASSLYSMTIALIYLLTYMITAALTIMILYFTKIFSINQMLSPQHSTLSTNMVIALLFMSFAGLPPLVGFLPKWMAIQLLVTNLAMPMLFILVLGSLLTLYFYLNIVFNTILLSPIYNTLNNNKAMTSSMTFIVFSITIMPIFMIYAMIMLN